MKDNESHFDAPGWISNRTQGAIYTCYIARENLDLIVFRLDSMDINLLSRPRSPAQTGDAAKLS